MGAFEKILLAQETILHIQNHPIVWLKKKRSPSKYPNSIPLKAKIVFKTKIRLSRRY
jgi:hypothetical protein